MAAGISPAPADEVARIEEALRIWNEDGLHAFAERYWAERIVWDEPAGFPDAGRRIGREAALRRMAERLALLGHVRLELGSLEMLGDSLLQELVVSGRGTTSGAPVEMREYFVLYESNAEGQVVRMGEFLSREEAVAAITHDQRPETASPGR